MHANPNCDSFYSLVHYVVKTNWHYDCFLHARNTTYITEHVVYGKEFVQTYYHQKVSMLPYA